MSAFTTNAALLSLLSVQAFAHPQAAYPWKSSHGHGSLHHHHHLRGTGYQPGNFTANSTGIFPLSGTSTSTIIATVSPVAANSQVVASDSSCATESETVTETATNIVTVTITPASGSSASVAATEASSSVSTEESSVSAASAAASTAFSSPSKAVPYHGPQTASSSVESPASPASSTESSTISEAADSKAPVYTPATSSAAEVETSSAEVATSAVAPSSSAASSSSATSAEPSSAPAKVKRGVAYNDASLTGAFEGFAGWAWNWVPTAGGLDTSKFTYIPTLHDATEQWTSQFPDAVKDADAKTIFTFNEPDNGGQANMAVGSCVSDFDTYVSPYYGQGIEIVAPAVTNSESPNQGLDYLEQFLSGCDKCQIDAINLHWYASYENAQQFMDYVGNASQTLASKFPHFSGVKDGYFTTYITEFGFEDGLPHDADGYFPASDSQQSDCLETVLPYLDSQDWVKGYSYFMVSDGLLVNGDSLTQVGSTYQKYTSS